MKTAPTRPPKPWLWLLLLLGAVALGAAAWLWVRFDPFVLDRSANKAAKALLETATKGPLSADEFDQAVALLGSGEAVAQLSAMAVLQLEASRDPARRPAVIAALEACQRTAGGQVATAAGTTLARVKTPGGP